MKCTKMKGTSRRILENLDKKKLQPSNSTEPSFDSVTATVYFTNTYLNDAVKYENT